MEPDHIFPMNEIIDTFDDEYINFMLLNTEFISRLLFEVGMIMPIGTIDQPTIIIGHVEGMGNPLVQYNPIRILHDLRLIHRDLLLESTERFKELFDVYFRDIRNVAINIAANALTHRETIMMAVNADDNNEWGTAAAQAENVHDGSVNMMLARSYKKLVDANSGTPDVYNIANINSYMYEGADFLVREINHISKIVDLYSQFMKDYRALDSSIVSGLSTFDKITDENDRKERIAIIDDFIENTEMARTRTKRVDGKQSIIYDSIMLYSDCLRVIDHINKKNEFLQTIGDHEINVLLNVWKRIHFAGNASKKDVMLDNLKIQLRSLLNKDRDGGVECVNGRICALIAVLELNDCDDIIDIKSVPAIRINMMQNRTPKIIQKLCDDYGDQSVVDRYLALVDNNDGDAEVETFRKYVKENCRKQLWEEFCECLSLHYFNKYMAEIEAEL